MSEITCLKELEEKGTLEFKDVVIFTVKEKEIEYNRQKNYLYTYNNYNDKIFRILEINKWEIAEKAYRYKPFNIDSSFSDVNWPESEVEDFSALTRLVEELYRIIEKKKPVFTKFTRFEIMDI